MLTIVSSLGSRLIVVVIHKINISELFHVDHAFVGNLHHGVECVPPCVPARIVNTDTCLFLVDTGRENHLLRATTCRLLLLLGLHPAWALAARPLRLILQLLLYAGIER